MSGLSGLIRDLRRRKVFRGVGFYLVAAWSVVQVADVLADPLGMPAWTVDGLLFLALVGLPAAAWVAWRYELSDGALVRTRPASEDETKRIDLSLRPLDYLVLLAFVAVIGAVAWRGLHSIRLQSDAEQAPTTAAGELAEVPASSIAVLPFRDLSQNADHAYLAEGLADTVLQMLSRVEGLTVTARTSSFAFRDQEFTATQIAAALGVAHLLEGSVQRAGGQLRVIARLVDARSSNELWSARFDRDMADLFAIQDEIAREVAAALKVSVVDAGAEAVARYEPTLEAYEQYVLGRRALELRTSEALAEAVERMGRAVELDPDYALARVGLVRALWLDGRSRRRPLQETLAQVEPLVEAALEQAPALAEAWLARSMIDSTAKRFEAANDAIDRAIELAPNLADAYLARSQLRNLEARYEDALADAQTAADLDPRSDEIQRWLSVMLFTLARAEAALATLRENIRMHPEVPDNYVLLARWLNQLGRPGEATLVAEALHRRDPDDGIAWRVFCDQLMQLWDDEAYQDCLRDYLEAFPDDLDARKFLAEYEGDLARAVAIAERELEANPRGWYTRMQLADRLLRVPDPGRAAEVLLEGFPQLAEPEPPVNDMTQWAARMLAQAYLETDRPAQAEPLLDAVMGWVERSRKLQAGGLMAGNEDAAVHILRGDHEAGIEALDRAVSSGWTFYAAVLRWESLYDPVRDDPRFREVLARLEAHLAEERAYYASRRDDYRI